MRKGQLRKFARISSSCKRSPKKEAAKEELSYSKQQISFWIGIIGSLVLPIGFFIYALKNDTKIDGMETLLKKQDTVITNLTNQNKNQIGIINRLDSQNRFTQEEVQTLRYLVFTTGKQLKLNTSALQVGAKQLSLLTHSNTAELKTHFFKLIDIINDFPKPYWQEKWLDRHYFLSEYDQQDFLQTLKAMTNSLQLGLPNQYLYYDTAANSAWLRLYSYTTSMISVLEYLNSSNPDVQSILKNVPFVVEEKHKELFYLYHSFYYAYKHLISYFETINKRYKRNTPNS